MGTPVPNDFCAYRKIVRDLVPYPRLWSSLLKQRRELWGWLLLLLSPTSTVSSWAQFFHRRVVAHAQRGEESLDTFFRKFEITEEFPEVYHNSLLTPEEKEELHTRIVNEYQEILSLISYGASVPSPENLHFSLSRGRWGAKEINPDLYSCPLSSHSILSSNIFFCSSRKNSSAPWVWCCSEQEILESLSSSTPALNPKTGERLDPEVEAQLRSRYSLQLKVLRWERDVL